MKGRVKFFSKFIVCAMSLLLATVCVFAGITTNKTKYANAAVTAGEKYSQKDEGDIVLSVEKVGVFSTGEDYLGGLTDEDATNSKAILAQYNNYTYPFKTALYSDSVKNQLLNQLYVDNTKAIKGVTTEIEDEKEVEKPVYFADGEYPSYYFKDIQNGTSTKTVYHSGDYIMLENSLKTKTIDSKSYTYYYNPAIKAYNDDGEVDMAQGVLFSFGSYRLGSKTETNNTISTDLIRNTQDEAINYTYAKDIQQINVSATRNGKSIVLPVVRQYGDNSYQDFSYIIPQKSGYDGHYEFVVEYRHNEEFKRQTFSFDLVFKSTYTEPEKFDGGSGYAYSTMPKLELPTSGTTNFVLGSSEQYPTLTYDFSKYTLDYTHTLNGVATTYSYRRVAQQTLVGKNYSLVCTISSSSGSETRTIGLGGETKAVLVFTEIGGYEFNYDYIYNGEQNSMGFSLNSDSLSITGFELKYSKVGYNEAQMRYLEINKNTNDKVVLIVPNGYELDKDTASSALGVAYKVDLTTGSKRTGVINKIQDAMINVALKKSLSAGDTLSTFVDNASKTGTDTPTIGAELTAAMYQTTNQGGIWLSSNLKYVDGESFYYYSTSPILSDTKNLADLRDPIINTTTFNKVGYYLVFIKTAAGDYQIFAFRYSNETTNIEVNALTVNEDGKPIDASGTIVTDSSKYLYTTPIGSGRYTNQPVKISWTKPGVFERAVVVKYYSSKNIYLTKYDEKANNNDVLTTSQMLAKLSPIEIENGTILGADMIENQGASYLIEATNEGQAKTYRSFTVDKTDITGVAMYAVKSAIGASGNKIYNIQTDINGNYGQIAAITNGMATIAWDDKLSGATVKANYYFTPIVKNDGDSNGIGTLNNTSSSIWFTNKYKLGSQTGPFYIGKPDNLDYTIEASNIIKNNGIYLFVLTDDAGNSCQFMFVCDSTEQYFKIGNNFYSQESLVFAGDVNVEFATHKAIELFDTTETNKSATEKMIELFVGNADNDLLKTNEYFVDDVNNVGVLKSLFNLNGTKNYLTIKNETLTAFEHETQKANITISKSSLTTNPNYSVNLKSKNKDANSYVLKLNLYSENQYNYKSNYVLNDSNSYIVVEINDDHSLGMARYAVDKATFDAENGATRLYAGANINGAHATSDNLVAFYFTQGTGNYEVKSINYDFYKLTNNYDSDTYFYELDSSKKNVALFTQGQEATKVNGSTNRYYALINVGSDNQTEEGYYVVTRTYTDNSAQQYCFIVDRKNIIDLSNHVGENINIVLLEETPYNNFNKYSSGEPSSLIYLNSDGSIKEKASYYICLETNKVPATIKVPVGKYFNGAKASIYEAGRLNLTIYYFDRDGQIGKANLTQTPTILFSSKEYVAGLLTEDDKEKYYTDISSNGGYLTIDLAAYLQGIEKDKYILSGTQTDWLCLPGEYVVVVEDYVASSTMTAHKTTFGFKIVKNEPATNVYSIISEDSDINSANKKANSNHILTTADEFVKVELQDYDNTQTIAQIDPNYIYITRSVDGKAEETYMYYKYAHEGGRLLPDLENGKRTIKLDTGLVRNNGVIDFEKSAKNIVYRVYVRFKISQGTTDYNARYMNCYQYYESDILTPFYETIYTITIDRVPPTANTIALEKVDNLAGYYNNEDSLDSMFNLAVHETTSGLYFTNELTAYASSKEVKDLYAFVVKSDTAFDGTDIEKLYYRAIPNLAGASLNIPVVNLASYTSASISSVTDFKGIFGETEDVKGCYEIVEIDAAGNQNQYIILYNVETSILNFKFNAKYVDNGEIKTGLITLNNSKNSVTLFELNAINDDADVINQTDKFYRIELTNQGTQQQTIINTTAATNFTNSGLTAQIVEAIKAYGKGNYQLKVISREGVQIFSIDYYDQNNRVELNARNLVEKYENNYTINLNGANITKDNILYYAKTIVVTAGSTSTTYICQIENGVCKYYNQDGGYEVSIITCLANTTYQIVLNDALGSTPSTCRFDTVSGFENFHNIEFSNNYYETNQYYSFNSATISFNTALYKNISLSYTINGSSINYLMVINDDGSYSLLQNNIALADNTKIAYKYSTTISQTLITLEYGKITLLPFTQTANGITIDYAVGLWYNNSVEFTYNVCLDSATKSVALKNTDNVETEMSWAYNTNYLDVSYKSISSGYMNLLWTPIENNYFTYRYILHEKMEDDRIEDIDLTGSSSKVINTLSDSKGVYWFEIKIYTADGIADENYLGNKVYAFYVVAELTDLYYVQTEDGAIKENSYFTFAEFENIKSIAETELRTNGSLDLPITNIPLYINKNNMTVVVAEEQGAKFVSCNAGSFSSATGQIGTLTLYRVYTNSYSRYLATLQMVKQSTVAGSINYVYESTNDDGAIIKNTVAVDNFTTSIYIEADKNLTLQFSQLNSNNNDITQKNSVVLYVYHNGKLLEQKQVNNCGAQVNYQIKGSGKYSFEIYDLAGNAHQFTFGEQTDNIITFSVMKNVYVTMNGAAPIDNAVFNDAVELTVYEPFNYDSISSKPVEVTALKNGKSYGYEQKNYTYIFSDYGNYKVIFTAKYNGKTISTVLNFSIVNKNEARASYDLTNVSRYNIVEVTNQNGDVITDEFLALISPQSGNGKLLDYQTVIDNADALGITAGKQSFAITYQIEDGIYPTRQASFVFTLNDEIPTIECSIELGKTTTKGFDITFNPGIIYEQVGDSYLYINDTLVCAIDANSNLQQITHSISQKTDGAGDYYVKLVGSSGTVITSFKVVVKEPLNVWAIIIIVVVSVIVLGVTITIIILRNKMRIR